jgi:hypothetical protein
MKYVFIFCYQTEGDSRNRKEANNILGNTIPYIREWLQQVKMTFTKI